MELEGGIEGGVIGSLGRSWGKPSEELEQGRKRRGN